MPSREARGLQNKKGSNRFNIIELFKDVPGFRFFMGKLSKNYFLISSYFIIKIEMLFETTATFFINYLSPRGVFINRERKE